jgi:cytochrome c peroxidase
MSVAKVELGRRLFYSEHLSGTGAYACASCHRQALAFTDGRRRAIGATGALHRRSSMSLANVAYNASLAWADPALRTLEDQAAVPMFNDAPIELGIRGNEPEVIARLEADPAIVALFSRAFPGEAAAITFDNVRKALASFERTLISGDSAYDRLVYLDDRTALSAQAKSGMPLFFSERLGCSGCHAGPTFSGPIVYAGATKTEASFHNTGVYNLDASGRYPPGNEGLARQTGAAGDMGRFRAPTLRNIAVTAPYMHDGSIPTLRDVVRHYAAGGRNWIRSNARAIGPRNPHQSQAVAGFEISPGEIDDLVAFLEHLTDASFLRDPRFADPGPP